MKTAECNDLDPRPDILVMLKLILTGVSADIRSHYYAVSKGRGREKDQELSTVSPERWQVGQGQVDEPSHGREARACRQKVQVGDATQESQTKGTLGTAHKHRVTWQDGGRQQYKMV